MHMLKYYLYIMLIHILPHVNDSGDRSKPEERGVIPSSFEHIFTHIARTHDEQYLVRASYLEIYQVRMCMIWFVR